MDEKLIMNVKKDRFAKLLGIELVDVREGSSGKTIQAEAKEISVQNRISGNKVDILDEDGSLVVCFSGLGYRKQKK